MRKLKKNQKTKKHKKKKTKITDVPNEILMKIFSYIDIIERQRLEIVCKKWRSIIRNMWRSLRKLKYTEEEESKTNREHIANGFHLVSSNVSHFVDVLKLYDGNLTKLDIEHQPSTKKIDNEIFSLLHKNENLITLKLQMVHQCLVIKYLKCSYIKNFKHLSIQILNPWRQPLLDFLEKALLYMTKLEYLDIPMMTDWTPKSFTKFESLKSLRLDVMKIEKLIRNTELETLCTGFHRLTDNELLEIVNNCTKLRHLDIFRSNITEAGLRPITSLPNLCYLNLPESVTVNRGIFNMLSNFEVLHCTLSAAITEHDLACFLERSPNLKECNFYDPDRKEIFSALAMSVGVEIRSSGNSISRINEQWTEVF